MMTPRNEAVLLSTDFKPLTGGVAEYLHGLWHHVARRRAVTVLAPQYSGAASWEHAYRQHALPPLPERQLGQRFGDQFPPLRKLHTARYFAALQRAAKRTLETIDLGENHQPSVFIGIWDVPSHFWCRELRHRGVPYAIHAHGLDVLAPLYGRLPHWRAEDFRRARQIVANSTATAALVREKIGREVAVTVLHPGVGPVPDETRMRRRAAELQQQLQLSQARVLLTVARLVPRKGIDLVLHGVARVAAKFPDVVYLVAGDGPEREHLHSLAARLGIGPRVRFLGLVDELTKWALYELCHVFVLPNRVLGGTDWEGFGMAFLEAALRGKPAIGGRNGGVPDAIEDGVTGLLVDPEQPDELVTALGRLVDDAALRDRMGRATAERARIHFNWDAIAASFCAQQGWD